MKKSLTIFVFMLVNIALISNIMIQHHHHGESICFTDPSCEESCNSHEHTNDNHCHDTDRGVCHHQCLAHIQVILPQEQEDLCEFSGKISVPDFTQAKITGSLATLRTEYRNPGIHDHSSPPFLFAEYPDFAVTSIGLRGPPSC